MNQTGKLLIQNGMLKRRAITGGLEYQWRKNKNWQLALKAVPIRGIDTYFAKLTTAHQVADDAGAPNLVVGRRVGKEGAPSPVSSRRGRRASSQIAEKIAGGFVEAMAVREHIMWRYGLIKNDCKEFQFLTMYAGSVHHNPEMLGVSK